MLSQEMGKEKKKKKDSRATPHNKSKKEMKELLKESDRSFSIHSIVTL